MRETVAFGPTAPKRPYAPPLDRLLPDPEVAGDDWLNLNVWTPSTGAVGLPVLVWIHGGSLLHGSSAVPVYDGSAFARDGVVLVSVNYRLGIEGFGLFPDAPANRGLLDQLAALEWVRDNIAAFGGDPDRVTVAGESAGAVSIAALLAAERSAGLFRRAVLQSGAPAALTPDAARGTTELIAKRLGVPATAAALAAVDPEALLTAQTEVTSGGNPLTGRNSFQLVVDGELLTRDPADALHTGAAAGVGLLMGTNTEEYRLWFVPGGLTERISRLKLRLALLKFKVPNATARVYRANRPDATPGEILGALATDLLLRVPLNRLADARAGAPASTYVYEFGWPSPVQRLGACHALEARVRLRHPRPPRHHGPDRPGRPAGAGGRDAPGVGGLRDDGGSGVAVLGRVPAGGVLRSGRSGPRPGPARRRVAGLGAPEAALGPHRDPVRVGDHGEDRRDDHDRAQYDLFAAGQAVGEGRVGVPEHPPPGRHRQRAHHRHQRQFDQ